MIQSNTKQTTDPEQTDRKTNDDPALSEEKLTPKSKEREREREKKEMDRKENAISKIRESLEPKLKDPKEPKDPKNLKEKDGDANKEDIAPRPNTNFILPRSPTKKTSSPRKSHREKFMRNTNGKLEFTRSSSIGSLTRN